MERGSLQAAREASSNNQPQHKAPKRDQLPRCKLKERIRIAGAETSALQATPKTATHKQSLQTNRNRRISRSETLTRQIADEKEAKPLSGATGGPLPVTAKSTDDRRNKGGVDLGFAKGKGLKEKSSASGCHARRLLLLMILANYIGSIEPIKNISRM
ncbi:hypothetical protein AT4G15245 [Arabidopsis thaliana]|uniref:Uncharacterized protein n=1 Tax=Arabidopsis thaliana TaxID=3702 RepID=A0A1P8B3W5_ARATH|nr:uncharacterized protein AT4G15245 [Arabidopsis thaliana]ANM66266.1 hypothetical protein AT4G15245 [Arabidopsis thaliana]|eukprot:NP_001328174.1 hypothetical protein AT4G15245 [Arabidopsis thaliana]